MELKIRNKETGESYKSKTAWGVGSIKDKYGDKYYDSRSINDFIRNGAEIKDEHYKLSYEKDLADGNVIVEKSQPIATRWQDEPATAKQYAYIRKLGYLNFEENMTKSQASKVIDMIKSGEASALNMFPASGNPQEIY